MFLAPDLDIVSQGKGVEESLENLREAIELYLEDEDAVIPRERLKPILTTVNVEAHAKASGRLTGPTSITPLSATLFEGGTFTPTRWTRLDL